MILQEKGDPEYSSLPKTSIDYSLLLRGQKDLANLEMVLYLVGDRVMK